MFDYKEARSYAMKLGLFSGAIWIVSFLLFAYTIPSLAAGAAYMLGLASIPLVGIKVRKYRQENAGLTMLRCWWMTWFTFMCTVLLTSAVQFVYFAYLDDGHFFRSLGEILLGRDMEVAYQQAQATDLLEQMKEALAQMGELSAKDITMSFTSQNLILGFIFSGVSLLCLIGSKMKTQE